MFLYIYDHSKQDFIEAESLYPHDIALLIDNTKKILYFYSGPKSDSEERKKGLQNCKVKMQKYSKYKLIVLEDVIPLKIKSEIDILMGDHVDDRRFKEKREISMVFLVVLSCIGIISTLIILINNFRMLGWEFSEGIFSVSKENFNSLFDLSIILGWISIGISIALVISSLLTKRIFLVTATFVNFAITLGLLLYLKKKEFIFTFNPGEIYLIRRLGILIHLFWVILTFIASNSSSIWASYLILTKTEIKPKEKVDLDELRLKSRPTILRDKPLIEMKEIEEQ